MNSSARPNSASLRATRPPSESVPKYRQKVTTANVRSTVWTDRPASVRQCVDFSALKSDDALASAVLLRSVVRKLEILSFISIACAKGREVVNHEGDLSKTDKLWQSLQLPHTPSPFCHAWMFGLSRRALALPWGRVEAKDVS